MTPARYFALALLSTCTLLAPSLVAQEKPADLPIAVINIDQVLSGYKKHTERIAPIREGFKDLEQSVQIRTVELETAVNQHRKAQPGSPEQVRLQGQILKLQNDLRIYVEQERQKLQKREVTATIATQRDVDEQIKKICKARGLKLVLRQNNLPDETQPLQELLKSLNRDVLYQDGLDITSDVLKALNEKPDGM